MTPVSESCGWTPSYLRQILTGKCLDGMKRSVKTVCFDLWLCRSNGVIYIDQFLSADDLCTPFSPSRKQIKSIIPPQNWRYIATGLIVFLAVTLAYTLQFLKHVQALATNRTIDDKLGDSLTG